MSAVDQISIVAVETAQMTQRAKAALRVRSSRTTHSESTFVMVRVTTSDGVAGYGEVSSTAAWSGEDANTATHFIRDLIAPTIIRRPLMPVPVVTTEIDRVLGGSWFTKAAVNTALWDALARTLEVPLAVLLGGPLRRRIPLMISLSGDGDELRRAYEVASGLGFTAFKVKVGRGLDTDLPRVRLARSLVGPEALIGVDANGGWSAQAAATALERLRSCEIAFAEQPVPAGDLDAMAGLRRLGVPIIADEAVYSPSDVVRIGRAGAADVVNIYVGKSGGVDRAVESARLAKSLGLGVIIGSNGEMGIGVAAQVHVACACPELSAIPSSFAGHHFYEEDSSVKVPVVVQGSFAVLPEGPGLGVEPSSELAARFSSR